jgi:hypothetical protein
LAGRIVAIFGIVGGFVFAIVPGVFAIRSYRRWTRDEIRRPTFAWVMAGVFGAYLVLASVGVYLLYTTPLLEDDFSDASSGWGTSGPPRSGSYVDGGYEVRLDPEGADDHALMGLVWDEGTRPNVAVEVDAAILEGSDRSLVGVACAASAADTGYAFLVAGDGTYQIRRLYENGTRVLEEGQIDGPTVDDAPIRIRGECRAGYGDHEMRLLVDGGLVATVPAAPGGTPDFDAVGLVVVSAEGDAVRGRFDDVYAIAIQPSAG